MVNNYQKKVVVMQYFMYFCSEKVSLSMRNCVLVLVSLLFMACTGQEKERVAPWKTTETDDNVFDLDEIQQSGELIALTLSGPETYYTMRGKELGLHFLLCQRFANEMGTRLRMETCRDTAEMIARLKAGDADLIAFPLTGDSTQLGWRIGEGKEALAEALDGWYKPAMREEVALEERRLLAQPRVRRKVFAPMLGHGVISHYDALFRRYAKACGWDWRLMAAQCYQESTFDAKAVSWAGAKGLMQIMPTTADHLGLARGDMFDPELNVAAASRLIVELTRAFSDIRDRQEQRCFVLASYNAGQGHIRDAMRLARRDGKNAQRWTDVRGYVLRLSQPEYYRDSLVTCGYMRGEETAEYVDMIMQRYKKYIRSAK